MGGISGGVERHLCSGYNGGGYRSGFQRAKRAGCYFWNGRTSKYSCLCDSQSLQWVHSGKCLPKPTPPPANYFGANRRFWWNRPHYRVSRKDSLPSAAKAIQPVAWKNSLPDSKFQCGSTETILSFVCLLDGEIWVFFWRILYSSEFRNAVVKDWRFWTRQPIYLEFRRGYVFVSLEGYRLCCKLSF